MSEQRGPYFTVDPTKTFADEWGVRDTILTTGETRRVKDAAEKLGVLLGHAPTGRTVQLLLQQAMNLALLRHSQSTDERNRRQWWTAYVRARTALGKMSNN